MTCMADELAISDVPFTHDPWVAAADGHFSSGGAGAPFARAFLIEFTANADGHTQLDRARS